MIVGKEELGLGTHNLLVLKVSVNVAGALKLGQRSSPPGWIGVLALDVTWNLASREEVDADGGRVPQSGVNTASIGVEAVTVGVGLTGGYLTPGIVPLTGRVAVAVRSGYRSGEGAVIGDGAPGVGVQGHVVRALLVDALDDINLATIGPVGSDHPADTFVSLCVGAVNVARTYNAGHVPQIEPGIC